MPKSKLVIYKSLNTYQVTAKSNYDKYIMDAKKVMSFDGFRSALEVINHLCKYFNFTEDEFIIVNE